MFWLQCFRENRSRRWKLPQSLLMTASGRLVHVRKAQGKIHAQAVCLALHHPREWRLQVHFSRRSWESWIWLLLAGRGHVAFTVTMHWKRTPYVSCTLTRLPSRQGHCTHTASPKCHLRWFPRPSANCSWSWVATAPTWNGRFVQRLWQPCRVCKRNESHFKFILFIISWMEVWRIRRYIEALHVHQHFHVASRALVVVCVLSIQIHAMSLAWETPKQGILGAKRQLHSSRSERCRVFRYDMTIWYHFHSALIWWSGMYITWWNWFEQFPTSHDGAQVLIYSDFVVFLAWKHICDSVLASTKSFAPQTICVCLPIRRRPARRRWTSCSMANWTARTSDWTQSRTIWWR